MAAACACRMLGSSSAMFERVHIRGYKSLRDVELSLGALTVFVGANGSGKTSLLEALKFFSAAFEPRRRRIAAPLPLYAPPLERVLTRGEARLRLSADLAVDGRHARIESEFEAERYCVHVDTDPSADEPALRVTASRRGDVLDIDVADLEVEDRVEGWIREEFLGVELHALDAGKIAQPAYASDPEPRFGPDGAGLAPFLANLAANERERLAAIEEILRGFLPSLHRIRFPRVEMTTRDAAGREQRVVGERIVFDFQHASDVLAEDASEGTLLLLGLVTILETSQSRSLTLLLDDIDHGLHPLAQKELARYLHELLERRSPNLQILATTHSPYLVEHLRFEEVVATTVSGSGASIMRPLQDHPEATRWRAEMSAGEFWSSVGEAWVS